MSSDGRYEREINRKNAKALVKGGDAENYKFSSVRFSGAYPDQYGGDTQQNPYAKSGSKPNKGRSKTQIPSNVNMGQHPSIAPPNSYDPYKGNRTQEMNDYSSQNAYSDAEIYELALFKADMARNKGGINSYGSFDPQSPKYDNYGPTEMPQPMIMPLAKEIDLRDFTNTTLRGDNRVDGINTLLPNTNTTQIFVSSNPTPVLAQPTPVSDMYFHLDAAAAIDIDDSSGYITWSLDSFMPSLTVSNAIQLQADSLQFPKMWGPENQPDQNFWDTIYIDFPYLSATAKYMPTMTSFVFAASIPPPYVNNWSTKAFIRNPNMYFSNIQELPSLQLRFLRKSITSETGGFEAIPIPPSVVEIEVTSGTTPAEFRILTPGNVTNMLGPIADYTFPPFVAPGLPVTISGFVTNDGVFNNLVNKPGFIAERTGPDTFTVYDPNDPAFRVDGAGVIGNYQGTMIIIKNQITMDLRITSKSNQQTNLMTSIHQ